MLDALRELVDEVALPDLLGKVEELTNRLGHCARAYRARAQNERKNAPASTRPARLCFPSDWTLPEQELPGEVHPMTRLVPTHALLALSMVACTPTSPAARQRETYEAHDARRVRLHRIYLDRPGIPAELAGEEMSYFGPFETPDGAFVVVNTTGRHVSHYEASGARVALHLVAGDSTSGDLGLARAALHECLTGPAGGDPGPTDLLLSYDDLVAEMESLAATVSGVTLESIGPTHGDREIMAIRFGPLEPIEGAPSLILVSNQHAREWVTVGVALGLVRWFAEVLQDPSLDPVLMDALVSSSIIIIPSANPDGYEYTRTDERHWRGNRNTTECAVGGVDLNRNLPTSWQDATDSQGTRSTCHFDGTFSGTTPQLETIAIESLLDGSSPFGDVQARALINYHSHASVLLYPSGYKASTDSSGPSCGMDGNVFGATPIASYCTNPDLTLLRRLFGDTEAGAGLWSDLSHGAPAAYYRDQVATLLYSVSGDLGTHAQYEHGLLAVSPELPGFCQGFEVEDLPDPQTAILDVVEGQKAVLRRVLAALPGLSTPNAAHAYAPGELGILGHTLFTREYHQDAFDEASAHGMFVTPIWRHADTGSLSVNISGNPYPMHRLRHGAQYNVYGLSSDSGAFDPHCPPCLLEFSSSDTALGVPGCEDGCVDFCDGSRLDSLGFMHEGSDRWGTASCQYAALEEGATLEYPGASTTFANTTSCYFTFSAFGDEFGFAVERDGVEIYRTNPSLPYHTGITPGASRQLVSYAFEANGHLPSATPDFTIRVTGSSPALGEPLRIYDPITYCRSGALR